MKSISSKYSLSVLLSFFAFALIAFLGNNAVFAWTPNYTTIDVDTTALFSSGVITPAGKYIFFNASSKDLVQYYVDEGVLVQEYITNDFSALIAENGDITSMKFDSNNDLIMNVRTANSENESYIQKYAWDPIDLEWEVQESLLVGDENGGEVVGLGLAIAANGDVYYIKSQSIYKIDAVTWTETLIFADPLYEFLNYPWGIELNEGLLFVANYYIPDADNNLVFYYCVESGTCGTTQDSFVEYIDPDMQTAMDVVKDPDGNIYVYSDESGVIQVYDSSITYQDEATVYAYQNSSGAPLLFADDNNLYLYNQENTELYIYDFYTPETNPPTEGSIEQLSVELDRLKTAVTANHEVQFTSVYGLTATANTMVLTYAIGFDLSNITIADIDLTVNSTNLALASSAAENTWGVGIAGQEITFTAPTSGTGYIQANDTITIKIGSNASYEETGVNQITNPSSPDVYMVSLLNTSGTGSEGGTATIPIVDSDQVNITGYVNTFINFDIDTAVADDNCAYNACLTHENGEAGSNYTVDLGELNSTWVNQSNSDAVMHTQGGSGVINSIYLDLTTNAYEGAIVYVTSENAGLQGPATNLISTVTDGEDIAINNGTYGFQLTDEGTVSVGTIDRNANCITVGTYCALPLTNQTVFTTDSQPLDTGRLRMDIAAAASYTNNPGLYTDTLTFTVVATY